MIWGRPQMTSRPRGGDCGGHAFYEKKPDDGGRGSTIVQNCVTSFMDDSFLEFLSVYTT